MQPWIVLLLLQAQTECVRNPEPRTVLSIMDQGLPSQEAGSLVSRMGYALAERSGQRLRRFVHRCGDDSARTSFVHYYEAHFAESFWPADVQQGCAGDDDEDPSFSPGNETTPALPEHQDGRSLAMRKVAAAMAVPTSACSKENKAPQTAPVSQQQKCKKEPSSGVVCGLQADMGSSKAGR